MYSGESVRKRMGGGVRGLSSVVQKCAMTRVVKMCVWLIINREG